MSAWKEILARIKVLEEKVEALDERTIGQIRLGPSSAQRAREMDQELIAFNNSINQLSDSKE